MLTVATDHSRVLFYEQIRLTLFKSMPKKSLLIVGSSSFLASYLIKFLDFSKFNIYTLSRRPVTDNFSAVSIEHFEINLDRPDLFSASMVSSIDTVRYDVILILSSILHFSALYSLVPSSSDSFFVIIGTTGIYTSLQAPTRAPRLRAELCISQVAPNYVIFRPNMISGGLGDRNISRLFFHLMKNPLLFTPLFNPGLIQPVYVKDLAHLIATVIENPALCRLRSYDVGGREPIAVCNLFRIASECFGLPVIILPIPFGVISALARLPFMSRVLPVNHEQIDRLCEPKCVDNSDVIRDFSFAPSSYPDMFSNIRLEYVRLMFRNPLWK